MAKGGLLNQRDWFKMKPHTEILINHPGYRFVIFMRGHEFGGFSSFDLVGCRKSIQCGKKIRIETEVRITSDLRVATRWKMSP